MAGDEHMPDGENTGTEPSAEELNARYALYQAFSKEVMGLWVKFQQTHVIGQQDPALFSRVTAHALLQLGATIAVDVHQTEGHFVKIARACHKVAYERAPKFG